MRDIFNKTQANLHLQSQTEFVICLSMIFNLDFLSVKRADPFREVIW